MINSPYVIKRKGNLLCERNLLMATLGKRPYRDIPLEHNGIQVNFCKNPACTNFGIPPRSSTYGSKALDGKTDFDSYRKSGGSSSVPVVVCKECGEHPTLKSNQAISEELERMLEEVRALIKPCPQTLNVRTTIYLSLLASPFIVRMAGAKPDHADISAKHAVKHFRSKNPQRDSAYPTRINRYSNCLLISYL